MNPRSKSFKLSLPGVKTAEHENIMCDIMVWEHFAVESQETPAIPCRLHVPLYMGKKTNLFFLFPTFPNAIWPHALEAMTFLKTHLNTRNKFLRQLSQGRHAKSHTGPPKSHLFCVFVLAHKSLRQLLFFLFFFARAVVELRKHYPAFTVDSETQMGTLLRCTNRIPESTAPLHQ